MSVKTVNISELLKNNVYPGRGIVAGMTEDGNYAACAYFIMGRSENSRNRVFVEQEGDLFTRPYDESKVEDPSLIIYRPVRKYGDFLIVTNGDQTDTIYDCLKNNGSFEAALETREFEPDAPNYTPRISALFDFSGGDYKYKLSILKSADAAGSGCSRYVYSYPALCGTGHFIHTYEHDGNPIPSFEGEPRAIAVPDSAQAMADMIWESLNEDNKISLYVSYIELSSGRAENIIINKNK